MLFSLWSGNRLQHVFTLCHFCADAVADFLSVCDFTTTVNYQTFSVQFFNSMLTHELLTVCEVEAEENIFSLSKVLALTLTKAEQDNMGFSY